ncbi:uncharacterized protein LOC111327514 isoform X1 [Stylophora pistillata]|uniref:uncharacterized protein LOC111327514 isoform X1 n=2 Tax=Stylophora pistillata TaxID=50429 RepID=UPI000C047C63|nr:uncharacterized protein LOC111327514 isoform X1 [Stylophora pistillata]
MGILWVRAVKKSIYRRLKRTLNRKLSDRIWSERGMALYSTSANKEQPFLPLIDNKQEHGHGAEMHVNAEDLNRRGEFAEDMNESPKTTARKYSSSNKNSQTKDMVKNGRGKAIKTRTNKKRGTHFHLPPLSLKPAENVKPVERWTAALGLRENFEIPRGFLNKLSDEVLRIDRLLREEAMLQQIRETRILSRQLSESTDKQKLSSFGLSSQHIARPKFSYFPSLTESSIERPGSLKPCRSPENKNRELMNQQELEIQRKMKGFKHRHSHLKHKTKLR